MRHPEHPGLLLNQSLGHFLGKDTPGGVEHLRHALRACGNYVPALSLAERLRQAAEQGPAAGNK